LNSTIDGPISITLDIGSNINSGNYSINGSIGSSTAIASLNFVNPTPILNLNNNIRLNGSNPFTISPTVNLLTNCSVINQTNSITFSSNLNGGYSLTLNPGASGFVTFNSSVGNTTPLTGLSFASASQINVKDNITVSSPSSLVFPAPVNLLGNSSILNNSGGITVSSTINGGYALSLSSNNTGVVTLNGIIGGGIPLTNLTFSNVLSANFGNNITLSGANPFLVSPPVNLTGNCVITNPANIEFSSTVNGAQNLTVYTGGIGNIDFSGAVGGTTPLLNINVEGKNISVLSSMSATGDIELQPLSTDTAGIPDGILRIYNTISGNNIKLAEAGRSGVMQIATITGDPVNQGVPLTINAANNVVIGDYEALTTFGDLTINSANATYGDIVALGSVAINTLSTNTIKLHPPGNILNALGQIYPTTQTHIYSGTGLPAINGSIITQQLTPSALPYQLANPSYTISDLLYLNDVLNFQFFSSPVQPTIPSEGDYIASVQVYNQLSSLSSLLRIVHIGRNFRDLHVNTERVQFNAGKDLTEEKKD
jgi:hypothetical protein